MDWEDTTVLPNGKIVQNANVGDEFEIDEEGAALFWSSTRLCPEPNLGAG